MRAFGTQLLCEQVIGRALRRVSYDPVGQDEQGNGMFEAEYADVLGIPFSFVPANSAADYKPPKPTTRVHAVLPEREALEITFPRVLGYRVVLPPGRLRATFTPESRLQITPDMAPPVPTAEPTAVRVRAVARSGAVSGWREAAVPGAVTAPAALGVTGGVRLSGGVPADALRLQVFEASSASLAAAVKLAAEPTALPWDRTGLGAGETRWYWLRAVSAEGNVSALAGPVTATAL